MEQTTPVILPLCEQPVSTLFSIRVVTKAFCDGVANFIATYPLRANYPRCTVAYESSLTISDLLDLNLSNCIRNLFENEEMLSSCDWKTWPNSGGYRELRVMRSFGLLVSLHTRLCVLQTIPGTGIVRLL